jgi:chromosome partitioning protein
MSEFDASPYRLLAIANQKGGVGKTTTAINLATGLAAVGRTVLLIDLDPQGNASTGLGIDRRTRGKSSYDLLLGEANVQECAVATMVPGLSVVPSTVDLSGAEIELVTAERRTHRLKDALTAGTGHDILATYDFVLIDCPPSLGLLTLNALVAAQAILVPLQCEFFALEGLSMLLQTVERIRTGFNPKLKIAGVVLTMYDRRNRLSEQVASDVRSVLGTIVFDTVIPRNVRVSEAPSYGKPAMVYDHECAGSQAYMRLAAELLRRARTPKAA